MAPKPKAKPKGKAKRPGSSKSHTPKMGHRTSLAELASQIERLFDLADENASGTIQFSEFLVHHKNFLSFGADAMEPERAGALHRLESDKETETNFHLHDEDHNLCLDRNEFTSYMETLYGVLGKRIFVEVCEKLIKQSSQAKQAVKEGFVPVQSDMLNEKGRNLWYNIADFREGVEKLLEARADPNYVDQKGSTVLIHAAERADEASIQMLLNARANPSKHNEEWDCAAFRAARARNLDVLELLVLRDRDSVDPDKPLLEGKEFELREKASQDLVRQMSHHTGNDVRDLLSRRAEVNYKDNNGWTPLTVAAFWGKKDAVEVLLRTQRTLGVHRLRLDLRNGRGRTALHTAARKGNDELIPMLVGANCDPDIQDVDGWTALHHAAFNGMDEAVKALIRVGATPFIRGRSGLTPGIAASMSTRAGQLGKAALKLLEVPETVSFGKRIAPILSDTETTVYDKLQAILELPGVQYNPVNLRLHEQFFPSFGGPSKVRLQKFWESLVAPCLRRFRSGETDLDEPGPHMGEAARQDRLNDIEHRKLEQKVFVQQWLKDTRGPRPSQDWPHDNRQSYNVEMQGLLEEELARFQTELDELYVRVKSLPGGAELVAMPAEERVLPKYCSQLHAHPFPVWLENPDPAGALEALRLVHSGHMAQDDDDAVMTFAELITLGHDYDTGKNFWKNIYRMWLQSYAEAVDGEFQKFVKGIVEKYNSKYASEPGFKATYKAARPKTYERMKAKEAKLEATFGKASSETYEGRTLAARILDVVRGSICVESPEAALVLIDGYFRPLDKIFDKVQLVKIVNRFHESAETLQGYRFLELNIHWDGGLRAGSCGRPGKTIEHSLIGEVQIVLQDYLNVRKRRHIIYKLSQGVYDWHPEDAEDLAREATMGEALQDD